MVIGSPARAQLGSLTHPAPPWRPDPKYATSLLNPPAASRHNITLTFSPLHCTLADDLNNLLTYLRTEEWIAALTRSSLNASRYAYFLQSPRLSDTIDTSSQGKRSGSRNNRGGPGRRRDARDYPRDGVRKVNPSLVFSHCIPFNSASCLSCHRSLTPHSLPPPG